jgi:hypothetical protein
MINLTNLPAFGPLSSPDIQLRYEPAKQPAALVCRLFEQVADAIHAIPYQRHGGESVSYKFGVPSTTKMLDMNEVNPLRSGCHINTVSQFHPKPWIPAIHRLKRPFRRQGCKTIEQGTPSRLISIMDFPTNRLKSVCISRIARARADCKQGYLNSQFG